MEENVKNAMPPENLHDVIAFSNRFEWCFNTTSSGNKDRGLAILVQWKQFVFQDP
jgi:hypothetical protein